MADYVKKVSHCQHLSPSISKGTLIILFPNSIQENLNVKDNKINTTQTAEELMSVFTPAKEFGFNAILELESSEIETSSWISWMQSEDILLDETFNSSFSESPLLFRGFLHVLIVVFCTPADSISWHKNVISLLALEGFDVWAVAKIKKSQGDTKFWYSWKVNAMYYPCPFMMEKIGINLI